jgi:hypothetical protein
MKTAEPVTYGHTVFCDDFRQEIGNKVSLIGIYRGNMLLPDTLPVVLGRFCIIVTLEEPRTKSKILDFGVTVNVFFPGDPDDKPLVTQTITAEQVRPSFAAEGVDLPPDVGEIFRLEMPILFQSFNVISYGWIRVRAIVGDQIIKVGALKLQKQSEAVSTPQPTAV